jgi:sucrose-6-phosphate hydrolase SacC (GH32 family)
MDRSIRWSARARSACVRAAAMAAVVLLTTGVSQAAAQTYPLYQEPWRPQFHFSQPNLFMNDPNGLVYYDGEWHLFYQSRPGGGIVWGHAVSKDLLHWQNLPIAIPRQANGASIFSGSVVIDKDNTSGFGTPGNPAMVAIYTASGGGQGQVQALAYSLDKGRTFTFYSGNPVIDIGSNQFRDPKVFWYEPTGRWVMVVANPDDHQVSIYSSPNLKQWDLESKWGPLPPVGGQYEVPDLFPLQVDGDPSKTKWVMIISTNPGGLWGGSLTAAYIGDFDGKTFKEDGRYDYTGAAGTTTFADFETTDHGSWTATGTAFGAGPTAGSLTGQPLVNGFKGQRLLNSSYGGGAATGTLTSPSFTISKRYINFLVGGTASATTTTVNLVVDGATVRSATGNGRNTLDWVAWDVQDLAGKSAEIRVVDNNTTANGRFYLDDIGSSDTAALPGVERTPWFDWGKDNYAGITFDNVPDGRRLFVGWLNNWQYAQSGTVPTTQWWRGQQSEPREVTLRTVDGRPEVVQVPLRELTRLRSGEPYRESNQPVVGERDLGTTGTMLDIEATLRPGTASKFGLKVFKGANGDETVVGYDTTTGRVYIDRTRSGTAAGAMTGFYGVHSAPLRLRDGKLELRLLIDNSLVEVFASGGERVLTDLVYPAIGSNLLSVFAEGGTASLDALAVHKMRSTWLETQTDSSVGGTVPATLSLTLGPVASFGAFTPGVNRDYTASTTATVTSTAASAALSVSDASSTATGRLVNGSFALPKPLHAQASSAAGQGSAFAPIGGSANPTALLTYAAPVSSDAVTVGFKQTIGAADALRTGSYSKTLTFTLSTTQP